MTTTLKTTSQSLDPDYAALAPARKSIGRTLSNALIITRREVRDSFRDWRIIAPIVILTFFFPFLAQNVANEFADFLRGYGAELIGERTIPFLLMIVGFFPISISLVIALETFVGEKERRSLEPLLSTPLTNTELYIGKTLAAMIPPLTASFGGMLVYLFFLFTAPTRIWSPPIMLVLQIFILTIVQALVMVTGAVVVSSQTTSTRAANLLASFIIIPMTLIINGESIIMFLAPDAESANGIGALWAIAAGMIVVVILLLRLGNSIFNREELLGRTIDNLNLARTGKKLWHYFRAMDNKGGAATNLITWYTRAVPYSLGKMRLTLVVTIAVFIVAFIGGFILGQFPEWRLPLDASSRFDVNEAFRALALPDLGAETFTFIVWQNGRVLLATLLLSMFSFGAMTYILTPPTYFILGYLLSQFVGAGFDLTLFIAGVLPHGIVEIPVITIAAAAIFRLGAIITRPPAGKTVGQAWLETLGDTLKIGAGVVIPGLIIAAILETYVTFPLLQRLVGG